MLISSWFRNSCPIPRPTFLMGAAAHFYEPFKTNVTISASAACMNDSITCMLALD